LEPVLGADRREEASIHKEEEIARRVYKDLVWEVQLQNETDHEQEEDRGAETKVPYEEHH
jgi:hypothetical protein